MSPIAAEAPAMTRRIMVVASSAMLVATLLSACGVTRGDDTRDLQAS